MQNQSYFYRCNLWLQERFPLINFISGFLLYLLARAIVDLAEAKTAAPLHFRDLFGLLIPAMHLFLLRVFDEHKDFDTDKIHYPDRVIQRGIFALAEVRALGYWAFALQMLSVFVFGVTLSSGIAFSLLWLWTLLMTKEFFIKDWIKQRLLLYGFLHLLITPILFFSLLVLCAGKFSFSNSWALSLILSLLTGWLYEISRKSKGPDEETGDQSYTKIWGVLRAMLTVALSTLLTSLVSILFLQSLGLNHLGYIIAQVLILLLAFLCHWQFFKSPCAKNRKKNEGMTALISAYSFLTPIIYSWWH